MNHQLISMAVAFKEKTDNVIIVVSCNDSYNMDELRFDTFVHKDRPIWKVAKGETLTQTIVRDMIEKGVGSLFLDEESAETIPRAVANKCILIYT